jgi:hypothetical protein
VLPERQAGDVVRHDKQTDTRGTSPDEALLDLGDEGRGYPGTAYVGATASRWIHPRRPSKVPKMTPTTSEWSWATIMSSGP